MVLFALAHRIYIPLGNALMLMLAASLMWPMHTLPTASTICQSLNFASPLQFTFM